MRRGRPPKHSKTSSTASAGSFDTSQLPDAVHSPHNPFTTTTTASRPGSGGSGGFSNTPNNRFTAPPGFFKEAEVGFGGQGGNRLTAPPAFLDAAAGVVAGFAGGEGVDGRRQSGVPSSSSEASLVDVGGAGGFGQTAGFGSFSTFPAQFDPVASSSPGLVPQQQQFTQQQQPPSPFDPFDPFAPQPHPQIRRDSHRSIADLKLALSSGLPPPQPHSLQPHPINTQPQPQTQSHPFTKSTSEMRLNNIDAGPRLHGHSRNKSWAQPRSPVGINTTNITPGMGTAPYFTPVGRHPHSHSVEHSRHASRDSFESSVSSLGAGAGAGGVMMMQGQEATTSPHVADLVRHFQQSASLIDDSSPMSAAGLRKHSVSGMMFPPGGFSQQQQQQQLQPPLKPPRPLGLPLNSPLAPAPVPLPSPMTPLPPTAYPSAHDPFFPASANWMAAQGMQGGDANVFGTSAGMSPLVPLQQRQGGVGQQGLGQHQQQASSRSVLDSKGDDFLRGLMER
ncbi:uncharacterized protein EV422DRAFT_409042 [Fimicolochytrium jonesii]|uniref:uncharacterized protein n=1 Tax=Fimicolochytrium jonesii TaxID=1396493 RepID=UPI0022FDDE00|nr:uncharacterized protein EV422DRAFT_409042 [Fimicolochytrium jonesii]KAI8822663.1 hypothetical protein EV422DRAFT_409042 [Fimicolochytrium jonesii]